MTYQWRPVDVTRLPPLQPGEKLCEAQEYVNHASKVISCVRPDHAGLRGPHWFDERILKR
jgi:hypothetical protein